MLFIYAGSLLVGLVMLAGIARGAARLVSSVRLARRGVDVTGRVTSIAPGTGGAKLRVQIAYEGPGGRTYEHAGLMIRPRAGQTRALRYDPADPARATISTSPGKTAAIGTAAVLLGTAYTLTMISGGVLYFADVDRRITFALALVPFLLPFALLAAIGSAGAWVRMFRWSRMTQVPGKIRRYAEKGPRGRPGILVSFDAGPAREQFWARAGSAATGGNDAITVYYNPEDPASTATVQSRSDVRALALGGTVIFVAMTIAMIGAFAVR